MLSDLPAVSGFAGDAAVRGGLADGHQGWFSCCCAVGVRRFGVAMAHRWALDDLSTDGTVAYMVLLGPSRNVGLVRKLRVAPTAGIFEMVRKARPAKWRCQYAARATVIPSEILAPAALACEPIVHASRLGGRGALGALPVPPSASRSC